MCQVNTDPMRSQQGFLEVVGNLKKNHTILCNTLSNLFKFAVPPTIVDSRTSSDVVVREGSQVNLTCEATGSPRPELRHDNKKSRVH